MSAQFKNLKVINGNTLIGNFSVSPDVPNKILFPPKISNTNCCIFFADLYNDYSKIESICEKVPITKNMNYHFYNTTGNCIVKLSSERKNNNFGTIRPKYTEWKFLADIKFPKFAKFESFFVFNKYPGVSELTDDDNKTTFILHDLKNSSIDKKIFCFVSKSIFELYSKLSIEFPFNKYKVVDDNDLISCTIETLFGKIISSGKPFSNGVIKCSTDNGLDNLNNTLHAQFIDKSIVEFQALRNGVVEYTANSDSKDGEFIIFYQYAIHEIFLNDEKVYYDHMIHPYDITISKMTNMFVDFESIKLNGIKFVSDKLNAYKTHYYKYNKSSDILDFNVEITDSTNILSIIKYIGASLLLNIRTELKHLESCFSNHIHKNHPSLPILGKAVSDGQFLNDDNIGKLYSVAFENY